MIEELPLPTETGPDEDNIITRTEYRFNEKNKIVKVIKKFKKYTFYSKQYKSALDRKDNWIKFGEAAKGNNNITFLSDDLVFMEPPSPPLKPLNENKDIIFTPEFSLEEKDNILEIVCKICNGNHWSRICPSKNIVEEKPKVEYIPSDKRKTMFTLQVTELSKDITEFDLYKLFSSICKINNIILIRDYKTQESKGFAYIVFNEEKDLAYVLKLNNIGFAHLRIKLEKI
jgi:hypothetical protein